MKQLDKKKDEELVLLSQKRDKPATDALLRRYVGLVRCCARQYFLVGGETEDLLQEGMIGLYEAIREYDPEHEGGKSFKNFAHLCISRRILDAVKTLYSKKNNLLHSVQPLDVKMVETGLSPEDLLILEDEKREFRQKMSRVLSDFEFKIMTRYMDGLTSAEICEETGKPYKSVDNAIQRSKKKLLALCKK